MSSYNSGVLAGAAGVALLLKLSLASLTYGTNDVKTWEAFLLKYQTSGTASLYSEGAVVTQPVPHFEPMNHPPLALTMLRLWGRLESGTGIPLRFWLRFAASLGDCACLYFLWKLFPGRRSAAALLALATAPTSIFLSGYHGNTDPIVAAAVVAAVYFATRATAATAGAVLALAVCIKIWPVVLIPAFLLYLKTWSGRGRFCVGALCGGVLFSLPYILEAPLPIARALLSYRGAPGVWGLSTIIPQYNRFGIALMVGGILFMTWRLSRANAPLTVSCGGAMATFLTFTPGFGVQYLSWFLPWVITLGTGPTIASIGVSGAFLFLLYTDTSGGLPWYFSDFVAHSTTSWPSAFLKLICWAVLVIITKMFYDGVWRCIKGEGVPAAVKG